MTEQNEESFRTWRENLNGCRLIVAPMVDQSELAWRMLSRRYGAQLCYTPMIHAALFVRDVKYQNENLSSCQEDRPLVIQFCANDPEILAQAAKLAEPFCDAVDINLGCPQSVAKRGHYGAYLQDQWDVIANLVGRCRETLSVPITCKIRVFEDIQKTIAYAQMLEKAGCQLLTVHGRTREQKGPATGLASWPHIKAVKCSVNIPVFANGNILSMDDVERCLLETGADGVMVAESNLHNPCLFADLHVPVWDLAEEYLCLVDRYPCPVAFVRSHLFKLFHNALQVHNDVRTDLGKCKSIDEVRIFVKQLKSLCQEDIAMSTLSRLRIISSESESTTESDTLPYAYWLSQSYVRSIASSEADSAKRRNAVSSNKQSVAWMQNIFGLSHKRLKKMLKNPKKYFGIYAAMGTSIDRPPQMLSSIDAISNSLEADETCTINDVAVDNVVISSAEADVMANSDESSTLT